MGALLKHLAFPFRAAIAATLIGAANLAAVAAELPYDLCATR
jgi:hypothetical protein